ncbi:MAG: hypothetical protein HC820_09295 [Hydrococcus sp. RM1_1_31]|nr:hypothetical protein [Hydrococcus sp. RM1_1_31]
MNLWHDYRFQFDLLQLEFARVFYQPKIILLALLIGASLTFCNEGTKSEQALLLVAEARTMAIFGITSRLSINSMRLLHSTLN